MRILVPAIAVSQRPSGVCRHAANLVRCLLSRPEISKVNIVVGAWAQEHFHELIDYQDARLEFTIPEVQNTSLSRNLWYYNELPSLAQKFEADIVHATYPVPLKKQGFSCPITVTLHDLYPYDIPQNFGYPRVFLNRFFLRQSLRTADAIACVSQSTLNHLTDRKPSLEQKAHRIYNCVEERASGDRPPLPELDEYPFLLTIAQHRRNKNLPFTLEVFRRVIRERAHRSLKLLIIGNEGPETKHLLALLRDPELSGRVILMSGVSDKELQWCYQHCQLLLSTSLSEGFGLPIAEAVLAGCRVVCSDLPVFREVSRDLCRFVPFVPSAQLNFSNAISEVLSSRKARPIPLPQFSVQSVAEDYVKLYMRLLAYPAAAHVPYISPHLHSIAQDGQVQ